MRISARQPDVFVQVETGPDQAQPLAVGGGPTLQPHHQSGIDGLHGAPSGQPEGTRRRPMDQQLAKLLLQHIHQRFAQRYRRIEATKLQGGTGQRRSRINPSNVARMGLPAPGLDRGKADKASHLHRGSNGEGWSENPRPAGLDHGPPTGSCQLHGHSPGRAPAAANPQRIDRIASPVAAAGAARPEMSCYACSPAPMP